ncbi:MAG: Spy0128 family protein [Collinsella sp.]
MARHRATVTNDADGKINFDKFEYDEPETYVYTISEVKGDETVRRTTSPSLPRPSTWSTTAR